MICVAFSRVELSDQLADIQRRHRARARRRRRGGRRLAADADAPRPIDRRAVAKPAAGAARGDRRIARLPAMAGTTTSPSWARATTSSKRRTAAISCARSSDTGLGVLRARRAAHRRRGPDRAVLTPEVRGFLMQPSPLIITKSNERSTVHRRVHVDYVGVKRFDSAGQADRRAPLRRPVHFGCLQREPERHSASAPQGRPCHRARRAAESGHGAKALAHVLETFPRDELFQISDDDLLRIAPGIACLSDRPARRRSCASTVRPLRLGARLFRPTNSRRLDAHARRIFTDASAGALRAAYPHTDEGQLARVHYIIDRKRRRASDRSRCRPSSRRPCAWDDGFAEALHATLRDGAR